MHAWVPLRTSREARKALAFVVLRDCPDYTGRLSLDDAARIILGAAGRRGSCRDYLASTIGHLEQLSIVDRPLRRLAARVEALAAPSDKHGEF